VTSCDTCGQKTCFFYLVGTEYLCRSCYFKREQQNKNVRFSGGSETARSDAEAGGSVMPLQGGISEL
jgi:hypothetical protein